MTKWLTLLFFSIVTALIVTVSWANAQTSVRDGSTSGIINLDDYLSLFPETSDRIIVDTAVVNRENAGVRILNLYGPVPQHVHAGGDTFLYVISGRGRFQIEDRTPIEASPGTMLYWAAGIPHGMPEMIEGPVTMLAFDAPFRDPDDIFYINPEEAPEFLYR